jgi:hypothetical protein
MTKPRKANLRAVAQANPFRPRYTNGSGQPAGFGVKPEIDGEVMGRSSRRTSRGDRGQRVGTDQSGTWETRQEGGAARRGNGRREQITAGGLLPGVGEAHSSEEAR